MQKIFLSIGLVSLLVACSSSKGTVSKSGKVVSEKETLAKTETTEVVETIDSLTLQIESNKKQFAVALTSLSTPNDKDKKVRLNPNIKAEFVGCELILECKLSENTTQTNIINLNNIKEIKVASAGEKSNSTQEWFYYKTFDVSMKEETSFKVKSVSTYKTMPDYIDETEERFLSFYIGSDEKAQITLEKSLNFIIENSWKIDACK